MKQKNVKIIRGDVSRESSATNIVIVFETIIGIRRGYDDAKSVVHSATKFILKRY